MFRFILQNMQMRHCAIVSRWEFISAPETNFSLLGRGTEQPSVGSYCCILLAVITTSKQHCILGEELCLSVYLMQQCKCSDKTIFRPKCLEGASYSRLLITATHYWDNLKLSPVMQKQNVNSVLEQCQRESKITGSGSKLLLSVWGSELATSSQPVITERPWTKGKPPTVSFHLQVLQLHCSEHPEEKLHSQDKRLGSEQLSDVLIGRY